MKRLLNYFLQGLLITVPITVTFVVIIRGIVWIDGLIPLQIPVTLPWVGEVDIPGLGIIILFSLVTILGYFASTLVANPFFAMVEKLMEKTPGLKIIYTSVNLNRNRGMIDFSDLPGVDKGSKKLRLFQDNNVNNIRWSWLASFK